MKPWEVLETELLFDRRYLRVESQKVRLSSGVIIEDFHMITAPPWVGVLAVTDQQELVLVEQYRHAHGGPSLELPAGIIDAGEEITAAARRELSEETGYQAREFVPLWQARPEPSRHTQWAHFCIARGARLAGKQALEETEDIRVVTRPLAELDDIVSEMVHAAHVAALLLAERRGLLQPR
jgi:8-oxo-dGTP pyrophosphatase MutT (NUDIX family)